MSTFNSGCRIVLRQLKLHGGFPIAQTRGFSFQVTTARIRSHQSNLKQHTIKRINHGFRTYSSQVPRPYVDPKYSYVFGKSTEALVYSTIDQELKKQIALTPDELMFVVYNENKEVTFKQFDKDVDRLAKSLVNKFNITKSDYVGIFDYNCYNWIVIQFACSRIGAKLTPINPSYKTHELAYLLKKGKVKCLFMPGPKSTHAELNNHLDILQSEKIIGQSNSGELMLESIIMMDSENGPYTFKRSSANDKNYNGDGVINLKLNKCQMFNWNDTDSDGIIHKSLDEAKQVGISEADACIINPYLNSPDDLFAVYYTSGTTGTPKGACVSQYTVVNNVRFCQKRLRQGRASNWKVVCVTTLPMFHIFAGVLNSVSPVVSNSTIVYSNYKYDIKAFVESIIKYEANVVTLTPTILIDMLSYIERTKISDIPLKIVQSGGAALSPEVVSRAFKTISGLEELRTGYGSTENGAVATLQTIHEPAEVKAHTVGPPLDFTEIRIVRPNSEDLVPHGVRGEIQTRGYNTMIEYLDDPKKTSEVLSSSRWYKTGDLGIMHPHGSIQISGRLKHLIIKGGENIYPEEVEQMIHTLEYVEDVHVVGVPDKRFGEQVCAWIKLKPGYKQAKSTLNRNPKTEIHEDDIIKFCKENITYFKIPKYYLFVEDFPMTPTKKVQSHIMTKHSIELLGLQDQVS